MAAQTLAKPRVQNAIAESMDRAGVTLDKMALRLNQGLDATHTTLEGEEKTDLITRHKYLDTAYKNRTPKEGDKHLHVSVTEEIVTSLLEE